jgi:hypothetical protein
VLEALLHLGLLDVLLFFIQLSNTPAKSLQQGWSTDVPQTANLICAPAAWLDSRADGWAPGESCLEIEPG